jgi:hypothetical protein
MLINCLKSHLKPKEEVVPDLFEHDCTIAVIQRFFF